MPTKVKYTQLLLRPLRVLLLVIPFVMALSPVSGCGQKSGDDPAIKKTVAPAPSEQQPTQKGKQQSKRPKPKVVSYRTNPPVNV
jgi:hypothetical protein